MKLSSDQMTRAILALQATWPEQQCPLCGHRVWQVQDKLFELRQFVSGGHSIGGTVVPLLPVTCSTCGNTLLFNALKLGVVRGVPGEPVSSKIPDSSENDNAVSPETKK